MLVGMKAPRGAPGTPTPTPPITPWVWRTVDGKAPGLWQHSYYRAMQPFIPGAGMFLMPGPAHKGRGWGVGGPGTLQKEHIGVNFGA